MNWEFEWFDDWWEDEEGYMTRNIHARYPSGHYARMGSLYVREWQGLDNNKEVETILELDDTYSHCTIRVRSITVASKTNDITRIAQEWALSEARKLACIEKPDYNIGH